jgi:hypothetical protein
LALIYVRRSKMGSAFAVHFRMAQTGHAQARGWPNDFKHLRQVYGIVCRSREKFVEAGKEESVRQAAARQIRDDPMHSRMAVNQCGLGKKTRADDKERPPAQTGEAAEIGTKSASRKTPKPLDLRLRIPKDGVSSFPRLVPA